MNFSTRLQWIAVFVVVSGVRSTSIRAQTETANFQPLPADAAYGLALYSLTGMISESGSRIPADRIDHEIEHRAQQWVAALTTRPTTGLQLDPLGRIAVVAGQDALAQRQFAERLATSKLSVEDRAYTLLAATRAFAAFPDMPGRMQVALGYLRQLDALSPDAVVYQFQGHVAVAEANYEAGNAAQVVAQLKQAFRLVPTLPFERRVVLVYNSGTSPFYLLADVLSGMSNGRQQIDSLGHWLAQYTQASPEQMRFAAYQWVSQGNTKNLRQIVQFTSYLGRPAPAITAHYWWNVDPAGVPNANGPAGARSKSLNDGTIRLMEFGDYGCPGCLMALPGMERIRTAMRGEKATDVSVPVDVWYVTQAGDMWGVTRCRSDEMAQHLKHYYVERKGYDFPIAVWIGPQTPIADGGSSFQESPSFSAYPIMGTPWFVITDGKGIVRHISFGFSEPVLMRSLRYLIAEAKRETPTSGVRANENTTSHTGTGQSQ